ncbi:MAG: right-handed parallel beta-helix repeat-containing protein [Anaerolineae bacterium]|nr:right-handed parallel beta-helix repeat-containing protein [Anaerolineae bacterium]
MKQVTQSILQKVRLFGMVAVIVSLLGINPVRAFDDFTDTQNYKAAAVPATVTITVSGGGQAAIAEALKKAAPGDTVLIKAGNYDDKNPLASLKIGKSGTSSAPITLLGEGRPKLGNILFENTAYFIMDGFEIANQSSSSFFTGISVRGSRHVTIRNMLIHHLTASAVSIDKDSSNITIEGSKIYEIVPPKSGTDAHCLVNSAGKNITFRGNECYGFIGDGFQAWRIDESIIYDRGTTLIEDNKIYNTKGACSENAVDIKGEAGTLIIRNNTLYGFKQMNKDICSLHASGCGDCQALNFQDGGTGTLLIENNMISDSHTGIFNSSMQATIQNNIFSNIAKYVIYDKGPFTKYYHNTFINNKVTLYKSSTAPNEAANNLFYNSGNTVSGYYHHNGWFGNNQRRSGSKDILGSDPRLNADYTLKADSPLINRGANLGLTTDLTAIGNSRPIGPAPDIGAFEFNGQPAVSTDVLEPSLGSPFLTLNGPTSATPAETFKVSLQSAGLTGNGLYGIQLDINYDPALVSVNNLQLNPDLPFVVLNSADNATGKLRLVASRQGNVPGLTGDITLLTFDVTTLAVGTATFAFENVKLGDPQATALAVTSQNYVLDIAEPEPEPTDEPDPQPTEEPTPLPTDEPDPIPTEEPTPVPTDEPTPLPTDEPTPVPTDQPTPIPTDEPTPVPTDEPTPVPTDEPTPIPTGEPTPVPTDEPFLTTVLGQVILAGRTGNNWSGATVTLADSGQSATTDAGGNFSLANVTSGAHTSISADAPGYLPAVCSAPTFAGSQVTLASIGLLSGDINDDAQIDAVDATTLGVSFGNTGPNLPADINLDGAVDIFDIILLSVNFGQGQQVWNCLSAQPLSQIIQ